MNGLACITCAAISMGRIFLLFISSTSFPVQFLKSVKKPNNIDNLIIEFKIKYIIIILKEIINILSIKIQIV